MLPVDSRFIEHRWPDRWPYERSRWAWCGCRIAPVPVATVARMRESGEHVGRCNRCHV